MSRTRDAGVAKWLQDVRAEYWARLSSDETEGGATGDLHVLFQVCGRRLAVGATLCKGVVRKPRVTRLPGLPRHILGVAGVRGEIVSVTDPAVFLEIPGGRPRSPGFLLVLMGQGVKAAAWVDRVFDVRPLALEEVSPLEAPREDGLVRGQWKTEEGSVLLLDGERYLRATAVGSALDPAS